MRGEDHGALDYWAMLFGLICFLAAWMWLGDWSLKMLIKIRPSLSFLGEFRATLKDELDRVIEGTGAIPIDKKR